MSEILLQLHYSDWTAILYYPKIRRWLDSTAEMLGANVMDWEPDMMLVTALAGARGF